MASPRFIQRLSVPDDTIDALGHVSNVSYVHWIQELARAHSEQLGYGHARYIEIGGVFVVRRHEIDYLRPAFAGEPLQLCTWVEGFTAATSRRHSLIVREPDGAELLRAVTTWAFVSTEDGRPRRIPAALKADFARAAAEVVAEQSSGEARVPS